MEGLEDGKLVTPAPSDNIIIIPAPKGDAGDIQFFGMPSLIKRVKKEPRRRKASKITGDSYETARPRKKSKTEGTSKLGIRIEDDQNVIKNFLSQQTGDGDIVFTNKFGGPITSKSVKELINNHMIIDDIIDAGQEFLMRTWAEQPDQFHKCITASVMTAALCMTSTVSVYELAATAGQTIFEDVKDEDKEQCRFLFTIINSDNSHWHLVAVDMERKVFSHLNSIKRNAKYKANAKKWHSILGEIFHIYCDKEDVKSWPMEEISDCPSQPAGSLDCGLYCLKYMECLARRDNPDMKFEFTEDEIRAYRQKLAAMILREGLNQKIDDIVKYNM